MNYQIVIFILSIYPLILFSQDECNSALYLNNTEDYCSSAGQYDNTTATTSGFGAPNCWSNGNKDVWFKFIAIASDVVVKVNGNINGMGTLKTPEVALYSGNCSATINELACATSQASQHFVNLYRGGLIIGNTYYIRVNNKNAGNQGTFQLCVNNYLPPPIPSQDCKNAIELCTGSTVAFDFQPGTGSLPDEAVGTCLDDGINYSETSSNWVKFTCTKAGKFTFTITPTGLGDDLDFAFYEIQNSDCSNKILKRCNASACLNRGGLIGLDLTSTDINEAISTGNDCIYSTPPGNKKNGWLKYYDLELGKTYAILINNFTSDQNGFSISFNLSGSGQAEIDVLKADFSTQIVGNPCSSKTFKFTDASSNVASYSWNFGSSATPSSATGPGPHTVVYSTTGTYKAILTGTNGGCQDVKSYDVIISNNSSPNAGTDGNTTVCESSTTTIDLYSLISGEQAGGTWTRPIGAGGTFNPATGTFTPAIGATTSKFKYTLLSSNSCPDDSSFATITITNSSPVGVSIAADNNNICSGTTVTFTATPTNGGSSPVYQWKVNGSNIGGNSATYSSSTFSNGDKVACVLTSNASCATGNPTTSNQVTMVVNTNLPVGVSIAADNNNICSGTTVTFTATLTNGGSNPVYQWKVNGSNVGGNSATYSSSTFSNGDKVECLLTSNASCATGNPATSNQVTMVVNTNLPVGVSIAADNNNICSGTTVTFTATPTNGGSNPSYQWKLNGSNIGGNSATYSSSTFSNGDKVECLLTSNASCATGNPATSNQVTMVVNTNLPVGVSIAADNNNICSGTTVTFTATPTNGGSSPSYQWKLNGSNIGGNSATYSSSTFSNGDKVACLLTSNASCATGNPATSNQVTMVVNTNLPVSVSIAADNNNICSGTTVTFTATPTNGGSNPSYQWQLNGSNIGGNSATYSSSTFSNGDKVECLLTSNASCATGNPATSNQVTMVVNTNLPVGVSIAADNNNICSGTTVTFTATPTNGGSSPSYQWKLNGSNIGGNSATYSSSTFSNGDKVACVLTSNASCATGNPATSNQVTMVVNTNLPVSVSIAADNNNICSGTTVTFTATPTNGGSNPSYQWKLNGSNIGGNSATYSSSTLNNNDKVECLLTSNASCATGNPATSNQVTMVVNTNLPVGVSLAADNNNICSGTTVTFTATPTNGGSNPSYQWKLNGSNIGGNSATYSSSTFSNGDKVECLLTSNASCATGNPATSNQVTMVVNTNLPVGVSIAADNNNICSGTTVTFTATPTNGGSNPSYQWKLNGSNIGGNSATYSSSTLNNNDKVECLLTSNASCATGNPATSNQVTMVVNTNLPVGVSIAADNNNICSGTTVTFTATPTNGGSSPVYQWKVNGSNVGGNSATYSSSTFSNGDKVECLLTSNASCATGNPATSNIITITVQSPVFAGIDGVITICESDTNQINLFSIINNEQVGGTWYRIEGVGGQFLNINGTFKSAINATNSKFIYVVQAMNPCANDTSIAIININKRTIPTFTSIAPICQYDNVPALPTVSSNGITGTWSPNAISSNTPGTYAFTFSPSPGFCASQTSTSVTIRPNASSTVSRQICSGQQVTVCGNTFSSSGTFMTTCNSFLGCDSIVTLILNVLPKPNAILTASGPTAFCGQGVVTLATQENFDSYTWVLDNNTISAQGVASYSANLQGNYSVIVANDVGCKDTSNIIHVSFDEDFTLELGDDVFICSGEEVTLGQNIPGASYVWSSGQFTPTISVNNLGVYSLTANRGLCKHSDRVGVFLLDKNPFWFLGDDAGICPEITLQLSAPLDIPFLWDDNSTLNPRTISSPGTYFISLSNVCGQYTDTITFYPDTCQCQLFAPNAFSPNGDQHNPFFNVVNECPSVATLQIYDRWGILVYSGLSSDKGWDGYFNGILQPQDTYIWIAHYFDPYQNVSLTKKGSLLLVK